MTIIKQSIRVNKPKEEVWKILADLGGVSVFHPIVTHSYYSTKQLTDIGATRVCELGPKQSVSERAIEWREGESYTLAVDFIKGMKPPVRNMQAIISVRADGDGSIATIGMRYQPKFGIMGMVMDRVMLRPQFGKMVPQILGGLKHYAETGEQIDRDVWKRVRVRYALAVAQAV